MGRVNYYRHYNVLFFLNCLRQSRLFLFPFYRPTAIQMIKNYIRLSGYSEYSAITDTQLQWTIQWTFSYSGHSATVDTQLQWTHTHSGHSTTVDTQLQWTLSYSGHSATVDTQLQWTLSYSGHTPTVDTQLQ